MMDKVTYKGKEEKRKKGYKVEVVRARHKPHRLGYKMYCTSYTGSPDSVDVARLVGSFKYTPEKRDEILQKSEDLKNQTLVR